MFSCLLALFRSCAISPASFSIFGFWGLESWRETGKALFLSAANFLKASKCAVFVSPYLLKKDCWNLKENSLHQGSNQGPLACLAEMLTITPSELVERMRSHQHLYYIFEYCNFYFIFSKNAGISWRGPVGVAANISANIFSGQIFFRPNFFSAKFFFRPNFFSANFFSAKLFFGQIFYSIWDSGK